MLDPPHDRAGPENGEDEATEEGFVVDPTAPYTSERERALRDFERRYFKALLLLHDGKVARAAGAVGMDRTSLYRLLRRHGIEV